MSTNAATDFFGGAPRFGPQNTFLGRKVDSMLVASAPADALTAVEDVLGSSEQARYAGLLDRIRSGALPVASSLDPKLDVSAKAGAMVAPKAAAAVAAIPTGFKMPDDIREGLRNAAKYDKDGAKLLEQYFGYTPTQQKIPMTGAQARTPVGNKITGVASSFIGDNSYVYGAWDCSAYTQKVIKDSIGVNITRSTASQMGFFQKQGAWTKDIGLARPGDVLYFRSGASPSGRHTGIYVGNGMMVDNAGRGVPIKLRSIAGRQLLGIGLATRL